MTSSSRNTSHLGTIQPVKVYPGKETTILELGFRKLVLVVSLTGFSDKPDNFQKF